MPWSLFAVVLGLLGFWLALQASLADSELKGQILQWRQQTSWMALGLLVLGCLIIVGLSGVGGYGAQVRDWEKHEIILGDLIHFDWPVVYRYHGVNVGMVYYIAYYLPAALVGKWLGIDAGYHFLALWTLVGIVLVIIWFAIVSRRQPLYGLVIFVFFSGLSIVSAALTAVPGVVLHPDKISLGSTLGEMHPGTLAYWQYRSHLVGLFWVPQHALPAWLFTALLLATFLYSARRGNVLWYWAATLLWSPFVTLGLAPLLLADGMTGDRQQIQNRLRSYLSPANLIGLVLMAIFLLFFASKLAPMAGAFESQFRFGTVFSELERWENPWQPLLAFLIFCLLEFGIYFAIDRFLSYRDASHVRRVYWAAFVWLLILPFFIFGEFNDLVLGASLPALFIVATIVGRNGYRLRGVTRRRAIAWAVVVALAAVSPVIEISNQLTIIITRGALRKSEIGQPRSLTEQYALRPSMVRQYVGSMDTFFFTVLARQKPLQALRAAHTFDPLLFADGIVLADVWVNPVDVSAGDQVELQLLFQALAAIDKDYSMGLRLLDNRGNVLWHENAWPLGMPTSTWSAARTIRYDQRSLTIPPQTMPGTYRLEFYLVDPDTNDKVIPQRIVDGVTVDAVVPIGAIAVDLELHANDGLWLAAPAQFGDGLVLVASNALSEFALTPGSPLTVELLWQTRAPVAAELTGFVHVVDEAGNLVAQHDHPIADRFVPPRLYREGLLLEDRYTIELPADLATGEYQILAGVYDAQTLERLPVTVAEEDVGDTFGLGSFVQP